MMAQLVSFISWCASVGGMLVSIPQIVRIVQNTSAHGISSFAVVLNMLSNVASSSYNIRMNTTFAAWGEAPAQAISALFILLLKRKYDGERYATHAIVITGGACALLMLTSVVPTNLLVSLPPFFGGLSVIPQILAIRRQGGIGNLAFEPVLFGTIGYATRLVTTLYLVPARSALIAAAALFALNASLLAQMCVLQIRNKKKGRYSK